MICTLASVPLPLYPSYWDALHDRHDIKLISNQCPAPLQMLREYDTELQAAREERSEAIEKEITEAERKAAAVARLTAPAVMPTIFPQPVAALGYDEDYLEDSISAFPPPPQHTFCHTLRE